MCSLQLRLPGLCDSVKKCAPTTYRIVVHHKNLEGAVCLSLNEWTPVTALHTATTTETRARPLFTATGFVASRYAPLRMWSLLFRELLPTIHWAHHPTYFPTIQSWTSGSASLSSYLRALTRPAAPTRDRRSGSERIVLSASAHSSGAKPWVIKPVVP